MSTLAKPQLGRFKGYSAISLFTTGKPSYHLIFSGDVVFALVKHDEDTGVDRNIFTQAEWDEYRNNILYSEGNLAAEEADRQLLAGEKLCDIATDDENEILRHLTESLAGVRTIAHFN